MAQNNKIFFSMTKNVSGKGGGGGGGGGYRRTQQTCEKREIRSENMMSMAMFANQLIIFLYNVM